MIHKEIISGFIDEEIKLNILQEDKDKLESLKKKILSDETLTSEDNFFILNDILSQRLNFDIDGNPIENTLIIEKLIDYFNSK